jgi:hypothetical protein
MQRENLHSIESARHPSSRPLDPLGGPHARASATFLPGDDQSAVESGCFALLRG